jgi:hypothetical protein
MEHASSLYGPARAYVQAAIELLARICPEGPPERLVGLKSWRRTGENFFVMVDEERPYWHRCLRDHADELHSLSEHKAWSDALASEPFSARHLDAFVGSTRGGHLVTKQEMMDCLIWETPRESGPLFFDSAAFDRGFAKFDADLRRDEIEFVIVAPIPGFTSGRVPIELYPDMTIDRLTDEEIARCLRMSIYPGFNLGGNVHLTGRCGIRLRFSEKKLFGMASKPDIGEIQTAHESRVRRFVRALHALRLFKGGPISIPGIVSFSEQWPMEGSTSGGPGTNLGLSVGPHNNYALSEEEVPSFETFWKLFPDALTIPFLDLAIRRFGYAGERQRPEDRLIDLLIAAESLFLSDAGETKERGELRYRLSLRFAFFAEMEGYSRPQRFRLMRDAYDLRSSLVHGGEIGEQFVKLPTGNIPFPEFVNLIEETLRKTLQKAVASKPFSKNKLVDWEALILN